MKKIFLVLFLLLSIPAFQKLNAQSAENYKLLHHWEDTNLKGSFLYNNTYNEIWGIVNKGREYAVIGSTFGTHFIDVTDSSSFKEVDNVRGQFSNELVVHRDYKDYKGYVYAVCDEGFSSTLQIIDCSTLPDSVHVVYDSNQFIRRSHNIFIDTSSARLYAAGSYGLVILSLADPIKPEFIGLYSDEGVHDVYVRNDTAYLNTGVDMRIVDFTDPMNGKQLYALRDYPEKGYNHNGWLNGSGDTYVFTDETIGTRVKVCSVSDLSNFEIVSYIQPIYSDSSMAHNVLIKEDIAYISYYRDGLQVYDISNPKNPVRIGYYNSGNYDTTALYMGVWGVYPYLPSGKILYSNMQKGLFVLEPSEGYVLGSEEMELLELRVKVYPNPIKDVLNIDLDLGQNEDVLVEVFDAQGKRLAVLMDAFIPKGNSQQKFDIGNSLNFCSVYILQVQVGERIERFKILR